MNDRIFKDDLMEVVFKQAVVVRFNRELDEILSDPTVAEVSFSVAHKHRMLRLFAANRRKMVRQTTFLWTRRIVAVFAILVVIFSAVLMTVPAVRAVVTATVIEWYDKFTGFVGGQSMETSQSKTEPTYLPEGFTENTRISDKD
ncbi:hypothetical protein FACS1894202_08530 [Clostridia bacterium]|nr:hypothetical protein FACS1894202_08530 [Clostridia bacterium]